MGTGLIPFYNTCRYRSGYKFVPSNVYVRMYVKEHSKVSYQRRWLKSMVQAYTHVHMYVQCYIAVCAKWT